MHGRGNKNRIEETAMFRSFTILANKTNITDGQDMNRSRESREMHTNLW
jgi:hypothetical protein